MRIIVGVDHCGGIAVAAIHGRFINLDFKGFAFFGFFGVELPASFSGDDEENNTGNYKHNSNYGSWNGIEKDIASGFVASGGIGVGLVAGPSVEIRNHIHACSIEAEL